MCDSFIPSGGAQDGDAVVILQHQPQGEGWDEVGLIITSILCWVLLLVKVFFIST